MHLELDLAPSLVTIMSPFEDTCEEAKHFHKYINIKQTLLSCANASLVYAVAWSHKHKKDHIFLSCITLPTAYIPPTSSPPLAFFFREAIYFLAKSLEHERSFL